MFKFFSKKEEFITNFYAVSSGKLIDITEVNDDVFSQKMLGDGFAILPEEEDVFSPIDGTISAIFPTKHAISIEDDKSGVEILLHMGIDTVELEGDPFEIFVKPGDKVLHSDKIAQMNLEKVNEANKLTDIIVAIPNENDWSFKLTSPKEKIFANNVVGKISKN
ncbi:hypothetical protein RD055328_02390 [Companilactobacillus sp. RD055328]|uniref:PTS sugar transporter subunit IIA n=1 Tax=Companilactobacillus sp. RD055328 TaxID=2916634 RepID=UPI0020850503|nr:PTS glucose transporter subunit IIA [Companilactobacillus sp. RD055328]GKQ42316.1 hypothetical protein RD055328_02390 [Companilactobacillus sp. RD055328]